MNFVITKRFKEPIEPRGPGLPEVRSDQSRTKCKEGGHSADPHSSPGPQCQLAGSQLCPQPFVLGKGSVQIPPQ